MTITISNPITQYFSQCHQEDNPLRNYNKNFTCNFISISHNFNNIKYYIAELKYKVSKYIFRSNNIKSNDLDGRIYEMIIPICNEYYKFFDKIMKTYYLLINSNQHDKNFGLKQRCLYFNNISEKLVNINCNLFKSLTKYLIMEDNNIDEDNIDEGDEGDENDKNDEYILSSKIIGCRNEETHLFNKIDISIKNNKNNFIDNKIDIYINFDGVEINIFEFCRLIDTIINNIYTIFTNSLINKTLCTSECLYSVIYEISHNICYPMILTYNKSGDKYILQKAHNVITNKTHTSFFDSVLLLSTNIWVHHNGQNIVKKIIIY